MLGSLYSLFEYAIYQVDTVVMTKGWLIGHAVSSSKKTHKDEVGAEQISEFLGVKNWSPSKVKEYLRMHEQMS